jgi:hypothetical protein
MLDLHGPEFNLKSTVFWDVTLCSMVEVYLHFGGTYFFQLQGRRLSV